MFNMFNSKMKEGRWSDSSVVPGHLVIKLVVTVWLSRVRQFSVTMPVNERCSIMICNDRWSLHGDRLQIVDTLLTWLLCRITAILQVWNLGNKDSSCWQNGINNWWFAIVLEGLKDWILVHKALMPSDQCRKAQYLYFIVPQYSL